MTSAEPRDRDRTPRLHGLFALMLAACIAIGAIAAAVALLDDAARPARASPASQGSGSLSAADGGAHANAR